MSPAAVANAEWTALFAAWVDAVVLPAGWRLMSLERSGTQVDYIGGRSEYVEWWEAVAEGPAPARPQQTSVGTWPVMALYQLVKDIREGAA